MNNNLTKYLQQYFNFSEFRKGQEEIIHSIIEHNNTLVVMPTGGGKSLCFQLSALILSGTAIVISPLIALMKDQHDSLQDMNFPATYINSSLSLEESSNRLHRAINGEYKLIYIAPERLGNDYFINNLKKIKISFLAVDEAHCISEWGHDFRPAYLNIKKALKDIDVPHIVALTATATPDVQKDIIESLEMKNPKKFVTGFNREELIYHTEYLTDKEKINKVIDILKKTKQGSTIIYCGSRKKTEKIYAEIIDNDFSATIYHAGLSDAVRKINQEQFINDEVKIIIATTAFGMGIDKSDVRNVVHLDLTGSVEQYYQEAGRAGRDGNVANCYLLYHFGDKRLQEFFIEIAHPTKTAFRKVYDYLYSHNTQVMDINNETIAINTGVNSHSVSYILKRLRSVGVLEKVLNALKGRIGFNTINEDILNELTDDEKYILDGLQRLYNTFSQNKNSNTLEFDEDYFSAKYNIPITKLQSGLKRLINKKIITYTAPIPANSIVLLKEKTDIDNLGINFEQLEKHRELANSKLDKMLNYASTDECKRNYILDYFDAKEFNGGCKKCSSCVQPIMDYNNKEYQYILGAAAELNGKFGLWNLIQYLEGKNQTEIDKKNIIEKYNLTTGKFYGKLNKEKNIKKLVEKCIRDGLLKKSEGEYPLISLTDKGTQTLKKDVKPIVSKPYNSNYLDAISDQSDNNYSISNDFLSSIKNIIYSDDKNITKEKEKEKASSASFFKQKLKNTRLVKKYINEIEKPANLSPQNIENMFKSGLKIDEISQKLNVNNGKIAEIVEDAINKKLITNCQNFTDIQTYIKVKNIVSKCPGINLRRIHSMLTTPINYALLRIIVAFVKNEY